MKSIVNKPIKVLFSDIDGTLTDGALYYGASGEMLKVFHVKDGAGIKKWMAGGFVFGVISARSTEIISTRMHELGVVNIMTGISDKKSALADWLARHNFTWENLAYIGDDTNDLPVIEAAGYSAAPSDAINEVIQSAKHVCKTPGGRGAVREFIDFLLDDIRQS